MVTAFKKHMDLGGTQSPLTMLVTRLVLLAHASTIFSFSFQLNILIKSISICHARNVYLCVLISFNRSTNICQNYTFLLFQSIIIRINLIYRSNILDILLDNLIQNIIFLFHCFFIYLSFFYLFRNTLHWHITKETFYIFFIRYKVILNQHHQNRNSRNNTIVFLSFFFFFYFYTKRTKSRRTFKKGIMTFWQPRGKRQEGN